MIFLLVINFFYISLQASNKRFDFYSVFSYDYILKGIIYKPKNKKEMKNIKKLSCFMILIVIINSSNNLFSQIKIVNNNVLVGSQLYGGPDFTLDVRGNVYISCTPAASGFYFTTTMDDANNHVPTFLPQWNNSARIGFQNNQLFSVHTKNLFVNGLYVTSDVKAKENIRKMASSLDKINKLDLIQFDYKDDYFLKNTEKTNPFIDEIKESQKNNNGFLAQDMQKVFPNLVKYDKDNDLLQINYLGLIPELTKSIQELSKEVDLLKSEITYLKSSCCITDFEVKKSENDNSESEAKLFQNTPNPFGINTIIKFYIPEKVRKADLYIYNMSGLQIKHIAINNRKNSSLELKGSELDAGMYIYSLVIDDQMIDSKRMIIIK